MATKPFTFDEQRLAIICFNHCYSQWVWNVSKMALKQKGRAAAQAEVRRNCRWFGSGSPKPFHIRVGANAKGTGMIMTRQGKRVAELRWSRFVDFMEENRTCPKATADVDVAELMSVLED